MARVVTYKLAYLNLSFELCDDCVSRGDHGRGSLGPVLHGKHSGDCQGRKHGVQPVTYKVWDVRDCVYEGPDRDAALAAWEQIPESRRNDRALCQIDVNGVNATSAVLTGEAS